MSQKQFNQKLLGIKDLNIEIDDVQAKKSSFYAWGHLTYSLTVCPHCGANTIVRNGFKLTNIRLLPTQEKPTVLKLKKQRYLCKTCHHSTMAKTSLVDSDRQISHNIDQAIMLMLTEDQSLTAIAQHLNVSVVTVNRVMMRLGRQTSPVLDRLPVALCFDEFRSVNHQMSFIAIDANSHELLTLLPDRFTRTIEDYFLNNYSANSRAQVKYVSVDFNANYFRLIKRLFPNAKIVADHFHLVQMILRAVDQTRVQLMKKFSTETREYRLFKSAWKLFLKYSADLETQSPQWFSRLRDRLTQEQVVMEGLSIDQTFEQTYNIAHTLLKNLNTTDTASFATLLKTTDLVSPQLQEVLKAFKAHKEAILTMMDPSVHYSNGPIEGVNRKVKQIKRTAYGYRNWSHFRMRIQIQFKFRVKKRNPIRK